MDVDNLAVNNINIFATDNSLTKSNIKTKQFQDYDIKYIIEKINSNDDQIKQKYFIDSYSGLVMFGYNPKIYRT